MTTGEEKAKVLKMAARYLGLRGQAWLQPPAGMAALLEKAYALALEVAEFKHRLVRCPVAVGRDGEGQPAVVVLGCLPKVESRYLARLLAGCHQGYALLATLGMELDLLLRRLMVTDPALAAATGACGSAWIDLSIDSVLAREQEKLAHQGEYLTSRCSPGYGDAPLAMQPGLLALCGGDALGVRLTRGHLMVPEKSVSAVMGITRRQSAACPLGCAACGKRDCPFREEEA